MLALSACDSFVEQDVKSQVSSSYLDTPEGFESAVNASYSSLRSWYAKEIGGTMSVFGTDTYQQGSDGSWKFFDSYTGQLDASAGYVADFWDEMYDGINATNTVIDQAESVEGLPQEVIDRRVLATLAVNAGVASAIGVPSLATITPAVAGYAFVVAILVGLCAAPYPLYLTVRTDTLEELA
jgi:hypothetical protein